jgi:hypothetical protein
MLMMLMYLTKRRNIKKNLESLIFASAKIGLAVNARKTMNMTMFRDQNTGRSHNIMIDNKSFDSLEQFKCLRPVITNQNSIEEGIKRSFNSGSGYL